MIGTRWGSVAVESDLDGVASGAEFGGGRGRPEAVAVGRDLGSGRLRAEGHRRPCRVEDDVELELLSGFGDDQLADGLGVSLGAYDEGVFTQGKFDHRRAGRRPLAVDEDLGAAEFAGGDPDASRERFQREGETATRNRR